LPHQNNRKNEFYNVQYVYDDVENSAEEHYCLILKIKINMIALCQAEGFFYAPI
jgi:hypothetical protein